MNKIWKFPVTPRCTIEMPEDALIQHVGVDMDGNVCLWAGVNPDNPKVPVEVQVVGTGHDTPDAERFSYAGSCHMGPLVWHVYVKGAVWLRGGMMIRCEGEPGGVYIPTVGGPA